MALSKTGRFLSKAEIVRGGGLSPLSNPDRLFGKKSFSGNALFFQESPRQTKPKKGQFMNFSWGQTGTKLRCESRLFSQGKTPELTKMGEIPELFVLALSLVCRGDS